MKRKFDSRWLIILLLIALLIWYAVRNGDLSFGEIHPQVNELGDTSVEDLQTLIPTEDFEPSEPVLPQVLEQYPSDDDWQRLREALVAFVDANQAAGFYSGYLELIFTGGSSGNLTVTVFGRDVILPGSSATFNVTGSGVITPGFTGKDILDDFEWEQGEMELVKEIPATENSAKQQIYKPVLHVTVKATPCIISLQMNSDTEFVRVDDPAKIYQLSDRYNWHDGVNLAWQDAYSDFASQEHLDQAVTLAKDSISPGGELFKMIYAILNNNSAWSRVVLNVELGQPDPIRYCFTNAPVLP